MVQLVGMMGRIGKSDDVTIGEGMVERIRRITGVSRFTRLIGIMGIDNNTKFGRVKIGQIRR